MFGGKPPDGWECPGCKKVQGVQGFNTSQTRKCRGQGGTCTTRICSACGQGNAKPEKECQICKDVRGLAPAPVRVPVHGVEARAVQVDAAVQLAHPPATEGQREMETSLRAEADAKEAAAIAVAVQQALTTAAERWQEKLNEMATSLRAEAVAKEARGMRPRETNNRLPT